MSIFETEKIAKKENRMNLMKLCPGCMNESERASSVCPHCGFDAEKYEKNRANDVLPSGTILNHRYIVGKKLGQGGFGITYLSRHIGLNIPVAIKEYFPSDLCTRSVSNTTGTDSLSVSVFTGKNRENFGKGLNRMKNEARLLTQLDQVPSIPCVYDLFEENNTAYLVTRYVNGCTLKEAMKKNKRSFSEEEALALLLPLLPILQVMHQKQILHLDISPDNLMIDETGNIVLIDFGSALDLKRKQLNNEPLLFKPGYSPSEQYTYSDSKGPWTDVYAFCATFFCLVTGMRLRDAMNRSFISPKEDERALHKALSGKVSESVAYALIHGLRSKVEKRTRDFYQLEKELLQSVPPAFYPSFFSSRFVPSTGRSFHPSFA